MNDFAIEASEIRKGFDGVVVLDGVDFSVKQGEVHGLVGANGAGKSTLMKILNGLYQMDSGTMKVFGIQKHFNTPDQARENGIAMVYQDLSLVGTLSVTENIFLARNPYRKGLLIDDGKARQKAKSLLEMIGVDDTIHLDAKVSDISVGQQQLVEIAKALASDPKILILDEPTASLSGTEIDILFSVIRKLRDRGISIIYITHYLRDIFKICDSVTVLRDGKTVLKEKAGNTSLGDLISAMMGETSSGVSTWDRKARVESENALLVVEGLTTDAVHDASLCVYPGEIVGIAGLLGSGRTELLKALFGCDRIRAGRIEVEGKKVFIRSPSDAQDAGIALAPEDRRRQGLILDFSIEQNIVLPALKRISRGLLLDEGKSGKMADSMIAHLGVKAKNRQQTVRYLSGGNQQKVVVAKCLSSDARILLLDDPTFGVDLHSKHEIMKIVKEFAGRGGGVVFVSSEFNEISSFCDVVYVMKKGRITGVVKEFMSEERLMQMVQ
ncbi:MAG: sugar ABC transporter ATP-binding protein [Rectinema sp.]